MFGTRYPLISLALRGFSIDRRGTPRPYSGKRRRTLPMGPSALSLYSRQDVLRILELPPRRMMAWEEAGLVSRKVDGYSFRDLHQMRALRDLGPRISVSRISASVHAMQRVSGMANPLLETGVVRHGSRVAFRLDGALVDPVTRQMAFDFDLAAAPRCRQLRVVRPGETASALAAELQEMFCRAVRLEEDPSQRELAVALYEEVLARDANHAPACINLGTIHYGLRDFETAETMYRRATVADPEYALAFFDLGNVLDEVHKLGEAIEAYERAVALVPGYADAHYNLALAYERKGEGRRALRHWQTYVRLDPVGPWASHAKEQVRKILGAERLAIVRRGGLVAEAV